ncbi:MAG: hypothetical protein IJV71_01015 [Lachnospiraceae bacterium]|nr:hypothetical protein [Lachnospiraceae bacterium]
MARKKNTEEYIELDDILDRIKRCKLPLLTLDIKWQAIFNTPDKSDEIAKLEKELNKLLKSQGRINTDMKDLKKLKKQLMNEIMVNMDSPDDSRARKKVQKSKELIEDINDKLILLEDEELDIPGSMSDINARLALESMSEIMDVFEENEEEIEELEEWIKETRAELKERVMVLQKKKDANARMEKYLTDMFDSDIINDYRRYREQD